MSSIDTGDDDWGGPLVADEATDPAKPRKVKRSQTVTAGTRPKKAAKRTAARKPAAAKKAAAKKRVAKKAVAKKPAAKKSV